jgi:hypothetical protein
MVRGKTQWEALKCGGLVFAFGLVSLGIGRWAV